MQNEKKALVFYPVRSFKKLVAFISTLIMLIWLSQKVVTSQQVPGCPQRCFRKGASLWLLSEMFITREVTLTAHFADL